MNTQFDYRSVTNDCSFHNYFQIKFILMIVILGLSLSSSCVISNAMIFLTPYLDVAGLINDKVMEQHF